jgi:hypothetical protein
MPLDNLEPTDTFDIVETKIDAAIDKIDEIELRVDDIDTEIIAIDTRLDNLEARSVVNETWSGTQAMTGSYATVGDLTFTTPNDGVTRYYQVIAEVDSRIELNALDPAWDFRLYNSTDATELRLRSFVYDEPTGGIDSFIVNPQNVVIYSGLIAPNKVIVLQTRYTVNSTTMDVKAGTLMFTEIYKQ